MGSYDDRSVGLYLNRGNGAFDNPVSYALDYGAPSSIAVGDLNGDCVPDLVVSGVQIFLGQGGGVFRAPIGYSGGGRTVALGDLDGDGKLDIVGFYSTLQLLLNTSR